MARAVAWAGVASAAVGAVALGQAATPAPATTQAAASTEPTDALVAELIVKLGADEQVDRDSAQRQLVDLGETASDALQRAAERDADPEVRGRATAALAEIRDRDANGPTLVTLHANQTDLPKVLADVGRQAKAELVYQSFSLPVARGGAKPSGPTITLDADRRPFWDVLSDICAQAKVCPLPLDAGNRNSLRLYTTSRNWLVNGPHAVVGPFCVGLSSLHRLSSIDLAGTPLPDDLFMARLVVYPEPKLVVTQISQLNVREAIDDAGNSLVAPPPVGAMARVLSRPSGRLTARTVEAKLKYPADHPGKRIVTLAGDLQVTLAQGARRFEAEDVMTRPRVTRPLPGANVRVAVTHQGTGLYYSVTVECARDGMPDAQWYAMTGRVYDLTLEDSAGHALSLLAWTFDQANSDTTFKATGTFSRTAVGNMLMNRMVAVVGGNNPPGGNGAPGANNAPPQPGEPARVLWNVAARFKVVTVPVAFHDLPMP